MPIKLMSSLQCRAPRLQFHRKMPGQVDIAASSNLLAHRYPQAARCITTHREMQAREISEN